MNIETQLLDATAELFRAYNRHPFVLGIQNGTLDREKFRYYLIQDCLYLEDYAKTFALGVAKAKSLETANLFAKYIPVMNGELDVHQGYLARLGVTQAEIDATPRALDNLSYTSYMLRVAYEEGEAEILAAILSCAPRDWIRGYLSESYHADNRTLFETLRRLTVSYSPQQMQHLTDIFVACSRYELAFWEMAWTEAR